MSLDLWTLSSNALHLAFKLERTEQVILGLIPYILGVR